MKRRNPFKSKSQARLFFAKEARGELAPGTAERWMDETPHFASLPEYVDDNPNEDLLVIKLVYVEGPQYWNLGRLVEVQSFYEANQQLDVWGDEGCASFVVYILGEPVYDGSYDLAVKPANLRRQMVLYLEQLGTEDAERLLGFLVQQNPEKGFIDPVTGAWRPASQFDVQLYEPGEEYDPEDEEIPEAVVSETIVEDEPTVEDINRALLTGTLGIGTSGLVTEAIEEQDEDEDEEEDEEEEEFDGGRFERPWPGDRLPGEPETVEDEADPQLTGALDARQAAAVAMLNMQFGQQRTVPWNPVIDGWHLRDSYRWVVFRRQHDDETPIYAIVEWNGTEVETLFTGSVDEVISWVQDDRRVRPGLRRISNNIAADQTYIVDGEVDADGFEQWVNDAVGFLNERDARANTDDFPLVPTVKVNYRKLSTAVPSGEVIYRLQGRWRIEERAAIFKHRMASSSFIQRFRLWSAGEADKGQRVQLFHDSGRPGSIRDVVIVTWLAEVDNDHDVNIVGFRLINGDNGIEIMNGQVEVSQQLSWNKGYRTVRKIMNLQGVWAVFFVNGWPEEYYLNVGYADNPFVYF